MKKLQNMFFSKKEKWLSQENNFIEMKKFIIAASLLATLASCSMSIPGMVTQNSVGTKEGVAERTIILGISFGHTDLSLKTAAKNGGITKIATVDYEVQGGLFSTTYRTVVTGE